MKKEKGLKINFTNLYYMKLIVLLAQALFINREKN